MVAWAMSCALIAHAATSPGILWQQAFGGRNARLLRELKQLHRRYLAAYLPEPAMPKRRAVAPASSTRTK